jgi:transcription elongation factor GreA
VTQQPSDQSKIWMTQESYDKLVVELEELKGTIWDEVVARIAAAREEGDLRENGGYHAAREEQGKLESRIRKLEDTLRAAEVGETPPDDGVVEPGMVVAVTFSDGHEQEFLFGAREMADHHPEYAVYSPQSPMGAAINGKKTGEKVSFEGPTGKAQEVTITSAKPFTG